MLAGFFDTLTRRSKFILLLAFLLAFARSSFSQTGESTFRSNLINVEAAANEAFRFNASLHNASSENRIYAITADLPNGWTSSFRTQGTQISSLRLEANSTQDVSIEFNAAYTATPGKYKIPVRAISDHDTLSLDLEAVVKGSYKIEMSTPSGRLSDQVISGSTKDIALVVKNTGTLPLNQVEFSSNLPTQWTTKFSPATIDQLAPGKSVEVVATITVPEKTIAGDYMANLSVKNANTNAESALRITVNTSWLSSGVGIALILLSLGLIYYLMRKYGRR